MTLPPHPPAPLLPILEARMFIKRVSEGEELSLNRYSFVRLVEVDKAIAVGTERDDILVLMGTWCRKVLVSPLDAGNIDLC
jgi:hypothetical protein